MFKKRSRLHYSVRRDPRTRRWALRIWFWRHFQNPPRMLAFYFVGHARAWKQRYAEMEEHEDIDLVQFVFSMFSIIIAVVLLQGHAGPNSSAFERMIALRLPYVILGITIRHWLGWVMLFASVSWLIGLMEWPKVAGKEAQSDNHYDRNMLRVLTRMQLIGTIIAGTFWFISLMLTIVPINDPIRIAPWLSLFAAKTHQVLAKRVSRKYVRARYDAEEGYTKRHCPSMQVATASGLTAPVLLMPQSK